jgi:NADH-quinone oxidoreductase subunit L
VEELLQALPWNSETAVAASVMLLPLFSFLLLMLSSKRFQALAGHISSAVMGLAVMLSIYLAWEGWNGAIRHSRLEWFSLRSETANLKLTAGIYLDSISLMMLVVVTLVSFLVHLFSIAYMQKDRHYGRYFAYLGLFTFNMLGLVLSDNLLILFMFWELVGFASYLLIGFWYQRSAANRASSKAFLVNRLGDVGMLLGLLILWAQFSTLDFEVLKNLMSQSLLSGDDWIITLQQGAETTSRELNRTWITVAGLCLFCGVMGKSAQFPLLAWLPDAMQGPTPVSALIHAATMVAAGVYLLARIFFLLDFEAHTVIAFIGAITAFMGAVGAFTRHDIKRVLAFSTISQLGYMVMGMGVGAYAASLFHLMTHAFFKAGLFLAAGSIIYTMHHVGHKLESEGKKVLFDPQDMRFMGGMGRKMPITFITYLAGTLALTGVPFFSGFLSKDAILSGALSWAKVTSANGQWWHYLVPALAFITAMMTAMYMGRQVLLVFFGKFRLAELDEDTKGAEKYIEEGPNTMKVPLMVLAVMSLGFFYALNPFFSRNAWFLQAIEIPQIVVPGFDAGNFFTQLALAEEETHLAVFILTVLLSLIGFAWAYKFYNPNSLYTQKYLMRGEPQNFLQKISYHNWYLDDLYRAFTQLSILTANLLAFFDRLVIDRIVDSTGKLNVSLAKTAQKTDRKFVDGFVNTFGVFHVIVAHVSSRFDKYFVDGIVNAVAYLSGRIGKMGRSIQSGQVQWYFAFALLMLVIVTLIFL